MILLTQEVTSYRYNASLAYNHNVSGKRFHSLILKYLLHKILFLSKVLYQQRIALKKIGFTHSNIKEVHMNPSQVAILLLKLLLLVQHQDNL